MHKALGVEFRAVQVATGHARTAHVQLPFDTVGHRPALGVEDVQAQVRNTPADGAGTDQLRIRCFQRPVRHVHGGFSDAVHVHQLRAAVGHACIPGLENRRLQGFATKNHLAQGVLQGTLALCGDQRAKGARRLVEDGDARAAQQRVAFVRRAAGDLRHHQQLAAVNQRPPDFPHGEIEGERVEQGPHVLIVETEPGIGGGKEPRDVTVFDHHAFGQTGGA